LAIHLANIVVVGSLARHWTADNRLAVVVAAAWGLHPICVESVAWLTNLKTVGFAWTALMSVRLAESLELDRAVWWESTDIWIVGLVIIGLGFRPEALIIPALVWGVLWRRSGLWQAVRRVSVMFGVTMIISAAYLPVALSGQAGVVTGLPANPYAPRRLFTRVTRALFISMKNVVWPLDLEPGYFRQLAPAWRDGVPGLLVMAGGAGAGVWLYRKGQRVIVAALLMAAAAYLPYSQLKPLPRLTADTYMYVPLVGLVIAAVVSGARLIGAASRLESVRRNRIVWAGVFGFGLWLLGMTGVTTQQVERWRDTQNLWIPYASKNPTNWKPFAYAGQAYFDHEEFALAASTYEQGMKSFRLHRHYPPLMVSAFERAGAPRKAWAVALEALQRDPTPPRRLSFLMLRLMAGNAWATPADVPPEILTSSVSTVASNDAWMGLDGIRRRLMIIFAASDRPALAQEFVRWELHHHDRPNCAVWIAVDQAGGSDSIGVDVPQKPARCEGVVPPDGLIGDESSRQKAPKDVSPGLDVETEPSPTRD
jgi:hypothetical protein